MLLSMIFSFIHNRRYGVVDVSGRVTKVVYMDRDTAVNLKNMMDDCTFGNGPTLFHIPLLGFGLINIIAE